MLPLKLLMKMLGKKYNSTSSCIIPAMMPVEETVPKKNKLGLISLIKSLFGF